MNANQHLQAAIDCLAERGKQYDNSEGERSMEATVDAFEAVTGHSLTETQGWLFMALLKAVRTQQGEYKVDSFIDGAAYFALAGESAAQTTPIDWDAAEKRMDVVGQDGNDGAAYEAKGVESATHKLELDPVDTRLYKINGEEIKYWNDIKQEWEDSMFRSINALAMHGNLIEL